MQNEARSLKWSVISTVCMVIKSSARECEIVCVFEKSTVSVCMVFLSKSGLQCK